MRPLSIASLSIASLLTASLALAACGKKSDSNASSTAKPGEAAKPDEAARPAAKPAAPAGGAKEDFRLVAIPATTIPACDALNPTITAYNGCAKISDEVRVVTKVALDDVPGVVENWKAAGADVKDFAKTAAESMCKDAAARMAAELKAAGC